MMSLIKDIPFIDNLFPLAVAVGLWTGVHILTIGPDLIAPRLAEKYYEPACRAGLKKALATAHARQRAQTDRLLRKKRAKLEEMNALTGSLLRQFFGRDVGGRLDNSPLFNPLKAVPPDLVDGLLAHDLPDQSPTFAGSSDYCGCIIAQVLGERVSTGLHSASLRIWKPARILILENLGSGPVSTPQCPAPGFVTR